LARQLSLELRTKPPTTCPAEECWLDPEVLAERAPEIEAARLRRATRAATD
jgi:hypothetical protein